MTTDIPGSETPAPQPPHPDKRPRHWPDVSTPSGAVLYAVIAGIIVWIIVDILSHVHIIITWH